MFEPTFNNMLLGFQEIIGRTWSPILCQASLYNSKRENCSFFEEQQVTDTRMLGASSRTALQKDNQPRSKEMQILVLGLPLESEKITPQCFNLSGSFLNFC